MNTEVGRYARARTAKWETADILQRYLTETGRSIAQVTINDIRSYFGNRLTIDEEAKRVKK
jgi:hypothetical protein